MYQQRHKQIDIDISGLKDEAIFVISICKCVVYTYCMLRDTAYYPGDSDCQKALFML